MSEREKWERGTHGHGELDDLIYRVIGCLIAVHKGLGPGFLERVYHRAVELELAHREIHFESEKEVELRYRQEPIGTHRLDLVVENELVVELKAVEELHKKHYTQVRSYPKATNKPVGLLANFADQQLDTRRVELNKQT